MLLMLLPLVSQAAVELAVPSEWEVGGAAATQAQRRANEWSQALNLPLEQLAASPFDDRFIETIAVFERPEPVSATIFDNDDAALAALAELARPIVGTGKPSEAFIRETLSGHRIAWGRWVRDDINYDCILAPSGSTSSLVIMAVRANSLEDFRSTFEQTTTGLVGVSEAMPNFSLWGWRVGSILVWVCLALGLHTWMLRYVDHAGDHSTAGSRAALVMLPLFLVSGLAVYFGLASRTLAIEHAGSSLEAVSVWVAVSGMCVVGVHYLVARNLDRGVVQSAPASGIYASGVMSSASMVNMRREDLSALSSANLRRKAVDDEPPSPEDLAAESQTVLPKLTRDEGQNS